MKIQFLGAAQTVTGSCYMMEAAGKRFAVDCGMHQGNREIEKRNATNKAYKPKDIDFFLITHAHIDHSGLLPRMTKEGFSGPVYCTPPTRDLLDIMLLDSAHIQEMEAEWESRKKKRHGSSGVEPLYTQADAEKVFPLFASVEYNTPFEPAPGITVEYKDAGHILGSAFVEMTIKDGSETFRLIFSGDLGRPDQLLLRDPSAAGVTDFVFLESTYGDRNHKDHQLSRDELAQAIAYSYGNGEKVIIPAFAVERTQEVLYSLYLLHKEGKLPPDMPVFLDSPLAIRATEVFRKHPKYFDKATQEILERGEDPLDLPNLTFTLRTEESMALNVHKGPGVIISASGMCNAGRIKHHLRHNLWRPGASVVFVGYQGIGTPGRRIINGEKSIRIHGDDVVIKAKIFTIGGFSAHAGQSQLLDWLDHFDKPGMEVFLVHGEKKAQDTLAGLIRKRMNLKVHIPTFLEECVLKPGKEIEVTMDMEGAQPVIDWDYVFTEPEAKLAALRERMERVRAKPWEEQADFRDRLLEITSEMSQLISEL